jgi:glycosyltransferase involved in cell wall biosynthesis
MPQVSVVIATHNRRRLLTQALDSALAQRGVDLEVVVVENGSTDGTPGWLRSLDDPRVRPVISERPLGATGARNEGLRAARGEWVGFLDDDDLWSPGKLRAQLDALESTGRTWGYTGCVYIDARGRLMGGTPPLDPEEVMARLPQRYVVPAGTSSMLWRNGLLPDDGLLDPRLTYMVDWDLALRLSRTGPPAGVPKPLVAYRQHGANMSVHAGTYLDELAIIDAKSADLRGGRALDVAYQRRNAGSEWLRVGARRAAAASYAQGVREGDLGSLARLPALLVPQRAHAFLRRHLLADRGWLRGARSWLAGQAT